MLGYQERLRKYYLLDPKSRLVTYSHNVAFDKSDFPHSTTRFNKSNSPPDECFFEELSLLTDPIQTPSPDMCLTLEPIPDPDVEDILALNDDHQPISPIEIQEDEQTASPPPSKEILSSIDTRNIIEGRRLRQENTITMATSPPKNYHEAMSRQDADEWKKAIEVELDNLKKHNVFTVVELPAGAEVIGSTWVYQEKLTPTGVYIKHKAHLCAQGFTQKEGINYDETYAPTGSKTALRCLLAKAAKDDLEVHKMDAVAAFLNGIPKEVIYLRISEGMYIADQTP